MAAMQQMNTNYVRAKVIIGDREFLSDAEDFPIHSISITSGCYDGNVFGIGNTYSARCQVEIADLGIIILGQKMEVYYEYQPGIWTLEGIFYIEEQPSVSGETMDIVGTGLLDHLDGRGAGKDIQLWGFKYEDERRNSTNRSILSIIKTAYPGVEFDFHVSEADREAFLDRYFVPVCKKFSDTPDGNWDDTEVFSYDNTDKMTARELLSGLAILFGGNVVERNGKVVFEPKTQMVGEQPIYSDDAYEDGYTLSRETYGFNSITVSHMPIKADVYGSSPSPNQTWIYYNDIEQGNVERVKDLLLASPSHDMNVKYDFDIENEIVGATIEAFGYTAFTQGDTNYHIGDFNFIGWSPYIFPGNLIKIIISEGNLVDFLVGEMTVSWDGGFTTSVSCNCDVGQNTDYSTSTSGSTTNASVAALIQNVVNSNSVNYAKVDLSNIADSTISGSKFIDGSISGSKFEDGSITGSKIEDSTITGSKIANSTIVDSNIKYGTITNASIADATLTGAKIKDATIVEANIADAAITTAKIKDGDITNAKIKDAEISFEKVDTSFVENLTASNAFLNSATINKLIADDADIRKLIFGSATGTAITTEFSNSVIAVLGDAQIKNAMIDSINANKITAGTIDTENVSISSNDGSLLINGSLQQFKDANGNVRIQIGKDAEGNFDFIVKDADGSTALFNAQGITTDGVPDGLIVDAKVNANANIHGSKLNIDSVIGGINDNGTTYLKTSKIYSDEEEQTLDVLFGRQEQRIDTIEGVIYTTEEYEVGETPTMYNYPVSSWTRLRPSDNLFPGDDLIILSDEELQEHIGAICFLKDSKKNWRFILNDDGDFEWKELPDVEKKTIVQKLASVSTSIDGMKSDVSRVTTTVTEQGTTIETQQSLIEQNAENITLKVSKDNILAEINASAEGIQINADKINLNGYVQFTDIRTPGTTTIDGGKITSGSVTATQIDVDSIFAEDITATGTISGAKIRTGYFGGDGVGWEVKSNGLFSSNSSYTTALTPASIGVYKSNGDGTTVDANTGVYISKNKSTVASISGDGSASFFDVSISDSKIYAGASKYTLTLPSKAGTIALKSDIPTIPTIPTEHTWLYKSVKSASRAGNGDYTMSVSSYVPSGSTLLAIVPIGINPDTTWNTRAYLKSVSLSGKTIAYRTVGSDAQAYTISYFLVYK